MDEQKKPGPTERSLGDAVAEAFQRSGISRRPTDPVREPYNVASEHRDPRRPDPRQGELNLLTSKQ